MSQIKKSLSIRSDLPFVQFTKIVVSKALVSFPHKLSPIQVFCYSGFVILRI